MSILNQRRVCLASGITTLTVTEKIRLSDLYNMRLPSEESCRVKSRRVGLNPTRDLAQLSAAGALFPRIRCRPSAIRRLNQPFPTCDYSYAHPKSSTVRTRGDTVMPAKALGGCALCSCARRTGVRRACIGYKTLEFQFMILVSYNSHQRQSQLGRLWELPHGQSRKLLGRQ